MVWVRSNSIDILGLHQHWSDGLLIFRLPDIIQYNPSIIEARGELRAPAAGLEPESLSLSGVRGGAPGSPGCTRTKNDKKNIFLKSGKGMKDI